MTPTEIIERLRNATNPLRHEAAALIETLLADKERLDWVESQGNGDAWVARQSSTGRGYRIHNEWRASSAHPGLETVREAIDAARSAEKGIS